MLAIIKLGGKQYKVKEGDVIDVEKLDLEKGGKIDFEEILLTSDGKNVKIGNPYVKGAKVKVEILEQFKDKKVIVFKYKPKKRYKRKKGHRQQLTKIKISKITVK